MNFSSLEDNYLYPADRKYNSEVVEELMSENDDLQSEVSALSDELEETKEELNCLKERYVELENKLIFSKQRYEELKEDYSLVCARLRTHI